MPPTPTPKAPTYLILPVRATRASKFAYQYAQHISPICSARRHLDSFTASPDDLRDSHPHAGSHKLVSARRTAARGATQYHAQAAR